MLSNWRKFNFFDVRLDVDNGALAEALKDEARVSCVASGAGCLVLGDSRGAVHVFGRKLAAPVTRRLFDASVTCVHQVKQSDTLVAVGEDETGVSSLKVFSLNMSGGGGGGAPSLVRQIRLPPPSSAGSGSSMTVSCVCVDDQRLFLCVGFVDGRVALWRGDVSRERCGKYQILHQGQRPITGLGFHSENRVHHLFVASTHSVLCYNITSRNKEQQIVLDNVGADLGCSVMSESGQGSQFTVARSDAIQCYGVEERRSQLAFEGDKQLLYWFRGHLVTVSKPDPSAHTTCSGSVLTVYDTAHLYVAMTSAEFGAISHVLAEWGSLYVISCQGSVHQLSEHSVRAKLNVLFSRNLYDLGIRLAQSHHYATEQLAAIFREYGDHLYEQGDHSAAIRQYIKTIGTLPASYVIRKYLDTQRVPELTEYLQAVHGCPSAASAELSTLLLNCLVKMRDTSTLDLFIQNESQSYDGDAAIGVCRQSGLPRQAVALARRHGRHSLALSVLIDDLRDTAAALDYIRQLPSPQCEECLIRCCSRLLQRDPQPTVDLLTEICCRLEPGDLYSVSDFVDLLTAHPTYQLQLLQSVYEQNPSSLPAPLLLTFLELYLTCLGGAEGAELAEGYGTTPSVDQLEEGALQLLRDPRLDTQGALQLCQIHQFHRGQMLLYKSAQMYEQCLQRQLECEDFESAVATCRQYAEQAEDKRAATALWLHVLEAMCAQQFPPQCLVTQVLQQLGESGEVSVMQVLDLLLLGVGDSGGAAGGRSGALPLAAVRPFLCAALSAEQQAVQTLASEARRLSAEAEQTRQTIRREEASAMVFQRTSCSACGRQLELPVVHFFCAHSFHAHCLQSCDGQGDHCPCCQPEHDQLMAQLSSQAEELESEAVLFARLQRADDVFRVVTEYIARGAIPSKLHDPDLPGAKRNRERRPADGASRLAQGDLFVNALTIGETEGRLRVAERSTRSNILDIVPEARIRASEWSPPQLQLPSAAETQLRAQLPGAPPLVTSAPLVVANASHVGPTKQQQQQRHLPPSADNSASKPTVQRAPASPFNPFEDDTAGTNPFEDESFGKNPFEDDDYDESKNPFASHQEYDESKNPFAE